MQFSGNMVQSPEVLNRYETLYFQPRQKRWKIFDPASSNHRNSTLLHGKKKIVSAISQLRLVGSQNTSLGSVAHGTLELEDLQIRKCHFF